MITCERFETTLINTALVPELRDAILLAYRAGGYFRTKAIDTLLRYQ